MQKHIRYFFLLLICSTCLSACGFHLQGNVHLAPALNCVYLRTQDPYGDLSRSLKDLLLLSKVNLVDSPLLANTVLYISQDTTTQTLTGINSTTLTQQYAVAVVVTFGLTDKNGVNILGPETLSQSRILTIQSNLILGSSNELHIYYQQMRRMIAVAIMNRIASNQVTNILLDYFLKVHETKSKPT